MTRGFTLLEVVVSLLLLELAVVGAIGTLTMAWRVQGDADRTERMVSDAEGVLDSLEGVVPASGGHREVSGGALDWEVDDAGTVVLRATRDDGRRWMEVTSALVRP